VTREVKQWSHNNNNNDDDDDKQSLQQQNGVEKLAAAEDASARERARGRADKEPLRRLLRPLEFVCAFEKR
jgi:hypothetical protein